MTSFEITLVITQTLLVCGGLYLAFFKTYFQEKGKNLATKEDIEEITKKVESIKTEFIKETERLKQELHFENQIKISFESDLKNSVIQVYESVNHWIEITYVSFANSLEFDREKIKRAERQIELAGVKYSSAMSKVELFIKNDVLDDVIHKLNIDIGDFQSEVENYFLDLGFSLEEEAELEIELEEEIASLNQEGINEVNESLEELSKLRFEQSAIKRKEFLKIYSEILKTNEKLRSICHNILIEHIKK